MNTNVASLEGYLNLLADKEEHDAEMFGVCIQLAMTRFEVPQDWLRTEFNVTKETLDSWADGRGSPESVERDAVLRGISAYLQLREIYHVRLLHRSADEKYSDFATFVDRAMHCGLDKIRIVDEFGISRGALNRWRTADAAPHKMLRRVVAEFFLHLLDEREQELLNDLSESPTFK